jgi:hypothetical protein
MIKMRGKGKGPRARLSAQRPKSGPNRGAAARDATGPATAQLACPARACCTIAKEPLAFARIHPPSILLFPSRTVVRT